MNKIVAILATIAIILVLQAKSNNIFLPNFLDIIVYIIFGHPNGLEKILIFKIIEIL